MVGRSGANAEKFEMALGIPKARNSEGQSVDFLSWRAVWSGTFFVCNIVDSHLRYTTTPSPLMFAFQLLKRKKVGFLLANRAVNIAFCGPG